MTARVEPMKPAPVKTFVFCTEEGHGSDLKAIIGLSPLYIQFLKVAGTSYRVL